MSFVLKTNVPEIKQASCCYWPPALTNQTRGPNSAVVYIMFYNSDVFLVFQSSEVSWRLLASMSQHAWLFHSSDRLGACYGRVHCRSNGDLGQHRSHRSTTHQTTHGLGHGRVQTAGVPRYGETAGASTHEPMTCNLRPRDLLQFALSASFIWILGGKFPTITELRLTFTDLTSMCASLSFEKLLQFLTSQKPQPALFSDARCRIRWIVNLG